MQANHSALGAPLHFEIETLTNHSPFELTLTAEVISTDTGNELVLFLPSDVAEKLSSPVPYSMRDLSCLGLPDKPVIVLGDSLTADYSSYEGTQYQCTIGNAERWSNDYVVYYRASVTSADIDAFNTENDTTPTTGHLWEELGKNHVLMGLDVKESPSLIGNLLRKIKPEHVIKSVSAVAFIYTAYAALQSFQNGFIYTALVYVPLALFGLYAVFITLPINKRFSVLATCFLVVIAGIV